MVEPVDQRGRSLRDLRISVTDRCNFRCRYCMPIETFGPDHEFVPREQMLSFEDMVRLVRISVSLGVRKIRLTGGEPLMRRGFIDLVAMISSIEGVEDLAMTTNGVLLAHRAEELALAGMKRVTVSLDALSPEKFSQMNGVGAKMERTLAGIDAALTFGLPVKINTVVQRGVNECEVLPLARWARSKNLDLRFIEYMDVGESNGWKMDEVVSGERILEMLDEEFDLEPVKPAYRGEVAKHWQHHDGRGRIGLITSVTQPFCGDCNRARVSAEGQLFTCLFSGAGHDLLGMLRGESDDAVIANAIAGMWGIRDDRYSELRGKVVQKKAEMSYLGG